jgi:WD40 repeat protein
MLTLLNLKFLGSFKSEATSIAIFDQTIFCAEGNAVNVRNMHGASKQQLLFNDNEGDVTLLDLNGKFLVAATSANVVKVWDLSRREVRQHGLAKRFNNCCSHFQPLNDCFCCSFTGEVDSLTSVRVSSNGTRVSFLGTVDGKQDSSVWVWDVEHDHINTFDFATSNRVPISQFWDPIEPRVCDKITIIIPIGFHISLLI